MKQMKNGILNTHGSQSRSQGPGALLFPSPGAGRVVQYGSSLRSGRTVKWAFGPSTV